MKYSTFDRKRKVIAAVSLIILIMAVAAVLIFEARNTKPAWDDSYPIVNANISWDQTYYGGIWK